MWKISTVMDAIFNAKAIRYFIAIFFTQIDRNGMSTLFIISIHVHVPT